MYINRKCQGIRNDRWEVKIGKANVNTKSLIREGDQSVNDVTMMKS